MKKVGAGGNWKRIDEKFDASIIKQTSGLSCVSAVGEMLLASRGISLSQTRILDINRRACSHRHFGGSVE